MLSDAVTFQLKSICVHAGLPVLCVPGHCCLCGIIRGSRAVDVDRCALNSVLHIIPELTCIDCSTYAFDLVHS